MNREFFRVRWCAQVSIWSRIEKGISSFTDGLLSDEFANQLAEGKEALNSGDADAALSVAMGVLATSPHHPSASLLAAVARWELGEKEEAIDTISSYLAVAPSDLTARFTMCRMKVLSGEKTAISELSKIENPSQDLRAQIEKLRGRALLFSGEYSAAIREFDASKMYRKEDQEIEEYKYFAEVCLYLLRERDLPRALAADSTLVKAASRLLSGKVFADSGVAPANDEERLYWELAYREDIEHHNKNSAVLASLARNSNSKQLQALLKLEKIRPSLAVQSWAIEVALEQDSLDSVSEIIEKVVSKRATSIIGNLGRAGELIASGHLEEARELISRFKLHEAAEQLFDAYVERGAYESAVDLAVQGNLVSPKTKLGKLQTTLQLTSLAAAKDLDDYLLEHRWLIDEWANTSIYVGPLTIAMIGEFSSGKTSLINTMVGKDILEVGPTPVTSIPTFVTSGVANQTRILNRDGTFTSKYEEANAKSRYVTLDSNALGGLQLVDTAGINTRMHGDRAQLTVLLEECDAAIWVFRAAQAGKKSELDSITHFVEQRLPIFALVSKSDLLSDVERKSVEIAVREALPRSVEFLGMTSAKRDSDEIRQLFQPLASDAAKFRNIRYMRSAMRASKFAERRLLDTIDDLQKSTHSENEFSGVEQMRGRWSVQSTKIWNLFETSHDELAQMADRKHGLRAPDVDYLRRKITKAINEEFQNVVSGLELDFKHIEWTSDLIKGKASGLIETLLFSPGAIEAIQKRDRSEIKRRFDFVFGALDSLLQEEADTLDVMTTRSRAERKRRRDNWLAVAELRLAVARACIEATTNWLDSLE